MSHCAPISRVFVLLASCLLSQSLLAQSQPVLIKEVISREVGIHVGGVQSPETKEVFSREISVFVENGPSEARSEVLSREVSVAVGNDEVPPPVTQVDVSVSPSGDSVTLNWSGYPQFAIRDIASFKIYLSDVGPFDDVTGLTPVATIGGGATSLTLDGLTPFTDHYLAVVAVDVLGNSGPGVTYSAAYVLSPEVISREASLFVGGEPEPPYAEVISREVSLAVVTEAPPAAISNIAVTTSPSGDSAKLDWSSYNQWAERDIASFEIYLSDSEAFTDVTGLSPYLRVGGGTTMVTLDGLTPGTDHFFAIVPVDALGNSEPLVNYAAAYVLSPETISREVSVFVGSDEVDPYPEIVSRETSILVPDATVPIPVTGLESGFFAETSTTEFGSVVLDWQSYNEIAQLDVVRYLVYVGPNFFDDVTGLEPFAEVPAGTQRTILPGLRGGGIFHFAVVAQDVLGNFNPAVRSFSAQASISGVGEVSDFTASSAAESIQLNWTAPAEAGIFLAGYRLSVGGRTDPVNLAPEQTSFTVTGLAPATGYPIRLSTVDTFGNVSDGISLLGATLLPNPGGLSLTAVDGKVRLLWDQVEPGSLVSNYQIYRSEIPFSDISGLTPLANTPGNAVDLGTFAEVSGNYFAVAAVNILGASDPGVISIQANKTAQTIDFPALSTGALAIPIEASASSGLQVIFTADPGRVATIEADTDPVRLIVHQGGAVRVTAAQAGNEEFWPASATQNLRLPPVITGFTVNGVAIADGLAITRAAPVLEVAARDVSGIARAEFFGRVPGAAVWTPIGLDQTPSNGLRADFPAGSLPPGPYELRVVTTAGAGFVAERSATVTLTPQPVISLALNDTLIEGQTLAGTVSLDLAPASDLSITLESSRPGKISAGTAAIIPAGQTSASFSLQALQNILVEGLLEIRITASAPGALSASSIVSLLDDDLPFLSLSIDRPGASESAGENAAFGRVEREPVTALPLTVTLENSDPTAATVPNTVTIPAGRASASFAVGTVDDDLIDGPQTAVLTALARLANGTVVSESEPVQFEVSDDEGPSLTLAFEQEYLLEGTSGAITLSREGASVTDALAVTLIVDQTGELGVPATLEIPAGADSATFTANALDDGVPDGSKPVALSASAPGFNPGRLSLIVTDETLPDLVPILTALPATAASESEFQISYRLENRGAAATAPPSLQRIYLSSDPVLGNDVLLAQFDFTATLDPGVGYSRTATVRAPREAGVYWIFVVADAVESIAELSEINNTAFSATPLEVLPEYSATVATEVEEIPANNPIPLSGSATLASGEPAPHRLVNIHIRLGETERIIAAITGKNGKFTTTWNPLPGEGGRYEIGATHPGIPTAPTQDAFTILTLDTVFPEDTLSFDEGSSAAFNATLGNPTETTITGLTFATPGAPAGLSFNFTLPASQLAPGAEMQVGVGVTAASGYSGESAVIVNLTSDQGLALQIPVEVNVRPLLPLLVVSPESLACSVLRGGQKVATFTIENQGSLASGPVEILLPNIPWLTPISPGGLPSIEPGSKAEVSLLLSPDSSVPLTRFDGNFLIQPTIGVEVKVPFSFRVVSDLKGDLEVSVVDEYFYFTAEAPLVEGATVTIRNAISAEEVTSAITGVEGVAAFTELIEGWYTIEVDSPNHTRHRENVFLNAGEVNNRQIFISRELVTYNWTVEEVEIEDRYRISVETTFEANVPAPVVTVTPAVLDVEDLVMVGQKKVVNLTLENHGLIASEQGEFQIGTHPYYEITPLIRDIGTLPAKSSITVPVTICRVSGPDEGDQSGGGAGPGGDASEGEGTAGDGSGGGSGDNGSAGDDSGGDDSDGGSSAGGGGGDAGGGASAGGNGGDSGGGGTAGGRDSTVPCSILVCYSHGYWCGEQFVSRCERLAVSGAEGDCRGGSPWNPQNREGEEAIFNPVSIQSTPQNCSPECAIEYILCLLKTFLPGAVNCGLDLGTAIDSMELDDFGIATISCACGVIDLLDPSRVASFLCSLADIVGCLLGLDECLAKKEKQGSGTLAKSNSLDSEIYDILTTRSLVEIAQTDQELADALEGVGDYFLFQTYIYGGRDTYRYSLTPEVRRFNGWMAAAIKKTSDLGSDLSDQELVVGRNIIAEDELNSPILEAVMERWILSKEAERLGIMNDEDAPENLKGRFIAIETARALYREMIAGYSKSIELGFNDPFNQAWNRAVEISGLIDPGSGVCARVRLRIDQEAVTTRTAFKGALDLTSKIEGAPLTTVGFDLDIRDVEGQPADELFNIRVSDLRGLGAIDGSGTIAALSTGRAEWTLIPRDSAAPLTDTQYTIGGTITYDQAGTVFSIPVEPVAITVRPDAALHLKYFHQRDVFSDDPHTEEIEPPVPFALAVLVENRGAGAARDLTITSSKPEIVDNEKGLFINFETIATEVAGENLSPSLTMDFGEIKPGESKLGTCLMTSTLQGLFIDYEATFEHLDGFGDPRISLIKEVEIHEMNHLIEALGDKADGAPDFLVNDIADIDDRPDTVHFSDGGTAPVSFDETASVDSAVSFDNLTVTLTTSADAGWKYVRIPDPGAGDFVLVSAVRSDGLVIPLDRNIWTTDRTFIGLGRRPIYENILHLADCDSTGSYTLTYVLAPDVDLVAPTSEIVMVPEQSGSSIPVSWMGSDEGGISGYDIFVKAGDGEWLPWLINTRRTSGIYEGILGETYRFYSRATDFAGNRQVGEEVSQASTSVSLVNESPIIAAIGDTTVAEGATFQLTVVAADPDGLDSALRFEVQRGPEGLVVDPFSGEVRWVTGENSGRRSEEVVIRVRDSGIPVAFSDLQFVVQVDEVNSAPVLAPLEPALLEPGETLIRRAIATDSDFPEQELRFSLKDDAPEGMVIDPVTGLISFTAANNQAGQNYGVTVVVSDDGDPARASATTLAVRVLKPGEVLGELPVWNPVDPQIWFVDEVNEVPVSASVAGGGGISIEIDEGELPGGIVLVDLDGDGSGTLRWDATGMAPGIYEIPLVAKSPGGQSELRVAVRIVPRDLYWEWAVTEFAGSGLPLDQVGIRDDPDGDGLFNGAEMGFFNKPLLADGLQFDCLLERQADDDFLILELCFLRRKGSGAYFVIDPEYSDDLGGGAWKRWDWDWTARIDPNGDEDDDPLTELVRIQVISPLIGPDAVNQRFYRLGLTLRPEVGE